MRKTIPLLVIGVLLVVAVGCSGAPITPRSNVPTLPAATSQPEATDQATAEPDDAAPALAGCHAVPSVGQELDNLPPTTADDWVRGPADATLTLIEYADFQ